MKICYFDAFSGISGDMTVGALLDAGADWPTLKGALKSLNLGASFRLERTKRKGIAAAKFSVDGGEAKAHRHLPHIVKIIEGGDLPQGARDKALRIFRHLGEAEARSHEIPLEKVHFHEVGAVDSICDIVGACVALDALGVEDVQASRINVGGGTVEASHGVLPVPAPATAELLKDCPVFSAGPSVELTTPTGAAILSTLSTSFGNLPPMRLLGQGFGAGDKEFSMQANVLRVVLGESIAAEEKMSVRIVEANIDDTNPQVLGYTMERLLAAGALDVTFTPVHMKKNRPGTTVSVIAAPEHTDIVARILFEETTTLGVRILAAERRVLARQVTQVNTPWGAIRVKHTDEGSATPEYEDCRQAAAAHAVPLRKVMAAAQDAFRQTKSI